MENKSLCSWIWMNKNSTPDLFSTCLSYLIFFIFLWGGLVGARIPFPNHQVVFWIGNKVTRQDIKTQSKASFSQLRDWCPERNGPMGKMKNSPNTKGKKKTQGSQRIDSQSVDSGIIRVHHLPFPLIFASQDFMMTSRPIRFRLEMSGLHHVRIVFFWVQPQRVSLPPWFWIRGYAETIPPNPAF